MFSASADAISLMVTASAVAATVTTIIIGALSDKVGKRKIFIVSGYILWGISIIAFAFLRLDILGKLFPSVVSAATLGISLTIILDCVMTFFGSSANDACFNAWLTEAVPEKERGKAEGINAMMPLLAIIAVFGGFMSFDLDKKESWTSIFLIIGAIVLFVGVISIFIIDESSAKRNENKNFWGNIFYGFRLKAIKESPSLYTTLIAFAVFGISIQVFMPYLIIYYNVSLGMENYVLIMAPAIIVASLVTAFYGRLYDKSGFIKSLVPTLLMLIVGYGFLYFTKSTIPVFIGSLFMMSGYLCGSAVFGAMIRDNIPENKAGMFQGLRIIGQVLIPGVIGPILGAAVLKNAEMIKGDDGTMSFVPNENIFLAAAICLIPIVFVLFLRKKNKNV
jgi:MFS family permease